MYIVRTPSHTQIQWLHSSGLMILEASKASKTQGRGLCGKEGPSWWGEGVVFPGPALVPGRFPWIRICWDRGSGQRRDQENRQCREASCLSGLRLSVRREQCGSPCQLSPQPGLAVSIPDGFLMPDNPSCRHVPRPYARHFHPLRSVTPGHPHNSPGKWPLVSSLNQRQAGAERSSGPLTGTQQSCSDTQS